MKFFRKSKRLCFFCIAYSFFLAFSFIGVDSILGPGLKILTNISLFLLICLIMGQIQNFTKNEIRNFILILMLSFAFIISNNNYSLFKLIIFTIALKNISFRSVIKFDIYLRLILITFVFILFSVGILSDVVDVRSGDNIIRHSYGFSNPNSLSLAVTILCFETIYIYSVSHFKRTILLTSVLMYFVTYITDSRTSLYAFMFYLSFVVLNHYYPKIFRLKITLKIAQFMPVILFCLTMYMLDFFMEHPTSNLSLMYDKALSGRLTISSELVKLVSPTLFGNDLVSLFERTVDNLYIYLVYSSGIIFSILFLCAYWILLKRFYLQNEINLFLIFFSFPIMGIGERLWLAIDYNLLMISFGTLLFRKKYKYL